MIAHYFNAAFRSLARQKGFVALNVIGLATAIAAVLLIFRMVSYEAGFNKNFSQYDRIVRIVTNETTSAGEKTYTRGVPLPAMSAVKTSVSALSLTARVKEAWPTVIVPNPTGGRSDKKFNTESIGFFAEPEFLQIFDFPWIAGDKNTALHAPSTVVLTREMAEKCFGAPADAPGKTLLIDNDPMVVSGVIENPPVNCDFPINILISYQTLLSNKEKHNYREDWGSTSSNDQMFGLLSDVKQMETANHLVQQIGKEEYAKNSTNQVTASKMHVLQPLADLHYEDEYGTSATAIVSKARLWILTSIGVLILLMACVNFINLSLSTALRRSGEVGIRKALGGSRSSLFGQFMGETALIVASSCTAGVLLAWALSPLLRHISEIPTDWPFLKQPVVWVFLALVALLVTFLSGFYPAVVISGYHPIEALRGKVSAKTGGAPALRKGLVVFQFATAQALMVGTLIALIQLSYVRNRDLGFRKDLIYTFDISGDSLSQSKMYAFKQRLLQLPGVETVTLCSDQAASGSTWMTNFSIGRGTENQKFNTTIKYADADFMKTYGLRLVAGRWLEDSDTTREFVVNETLLRRSGIQRPEEALDKEVRLGTQGWRKVVGVVQDFHAHSLHRPVEPLVMACSLDRLYGASVKINPSRIQATVAAIQQEFDATYPEQVLSSHWFDESLADFYISEDRFASTCKGFGILALLISCLGLLGLAAHTAQQRTKEIGIRKVLGASVAGITGLLAKDFLRLVMVAVVVASPIAWYLMDKWLSDFAYRITMPWWIFPLCGLAALVIAFLTVGVQSVKAAWANPVDSLKNE